MATDNPQLEPLTLPKHGEYTHRAHRFPGKFHPPLIAKILRDHSDHEVVADPMCGSGTVGVEGVVHSKYVLSVDIDPLCALMTRAKTNPVDPQNLRSIRESIIEGVEGFPDEGDVGAEEATDEVKENLAGTPFCIPINLYHWFEPYVAVGFSRLLVSAQDQLASECQAMNDAVRTSLAAMVRRISRADPEPVSGLEVTKVRKEQLEEGVNFDVKGSFRRVVNRLANGYEELEGVDHLGTSCVVEGDSRRFSGICSEEGYSPSLVITSPPYCNAIEYHRRHRLEYEWLGLFNGENVEDPRDERISTSREFFGSTTPRQDTLRNVPAPPHPKVREITERIEAKGKERKANLLRHYFVDAKKWLSEIHEALSDNGVLCMTVGPSTSYGETLDTPKFLADIGTDVGFRGGIDRRYKLINNKMQYPTNYDGPTEAILKLEK